MSARRQEAGITAAQRRMLQAARRQLRLPDDVYRDILRVQAGVSSSTQLGQDGLEAVLRFFVSLGWRNTSPKKRLGLRPGMASDAQLALLRRLAGEYFGQDEAKLRKWLERTFHVSAPRFIRAETASKAIEALKEMTARRAPPAA